MSCWCSSLLLFVIGVGGVVCCHVSRCVSALFLVVCLDNGVVVLSLFVVCVCRLLVLRTLLVLFVVVVVVSDCVFLCRCVFLSSFVLFGGCCANVGYCCSCVLLLLVGVVGW